MELLKKISPTASFYLSTDSDEIPISVGGGDGIPFEASWDKTGFRPTNLDAHEHVVPISREEFERLVLMKEPL